MSCGGSGSQSTPADPTASLTPQTPDPNQPGSTDANGTTVDGGSSGPTPDAATPQPQLEAAYGVIFPVPLGALGGLALDAEGEGLLAAGAGAGEAVSALDTAFVEGTGGLTESAPAVADATADLGAETTASSTSQGTTYAEGTSSTWDPSAVPQTGRVLNVATDVPPAEFQANLEANGYSVTAQGVSGNGPFTVLSNGGRTYTIYTATSTGEASAAVYDVAGESVLKYRFFGQ
jgi:hypothetical protein